MSDTPKIINVDSKTMLDLASAFEKLTEFLEWLGNKGDAEAFDKFKPILLRIHRLMFAILAGNDPDFARVVDAIEQVEDEVNAALTKATTPEEIAAIRRQSKEGWKMFVEASQKISRDLDARAQSEKKERPH